MISVIVLNKESMIQTMASLGYTQCVHQGTIVPYTVACKHSACYSYRVIRNENEISSQQVMVFRNRKTGLYATYCPYCKRIDLSLNHPVKRSTLMVIIYIDRVTKREDFVLVCSACLETTNCEEAMNDDLVAIIPLTEDVKKSLVGFTEHRPLKCRTCGDSFV